MNFPLLKIANPIWYNYLPSLQEDVRYWADYRKLKPEEQQLVDYSDVYEDEVVVLMDAAYQVWHKGFIDISGSYSLVSGITDLKKFAKRVHFDQGSWHIMIIRSQPYFRRHKQ